MQEYRKRMEEKGLVQVRVWVEKQDFAEKGEKKNQKNDLDVWRAIIKSESPRQLH